MCILAAFQMCWRAQERLSKGISIALHFRGAVLGTISSRFCNLDSYHVEPYANEHAVAAFLRNHAVQTNSSAAVCAQHVEFTLTSHLILRILCTPSLAIFIPHSLTPCATCLQNVCSYRVPLDFGCQFCLCATASLRYPTFSACANPETLTVRLQYIA